MTEPTFMRLGMYIMTPEPISTAYFLSLYVYPLSLLGNGLVKSYRGNKYTEELFDASFYVGPCRIKGK
jgi:hypothetical protein